MKSIIMPIAVTLLLTACGGSDGNSSGAPAPAPVASITVTPDAVSLEPGGSAQLSAILRDANGNVLSGRTVSWASNQAEKATVTAAGLVQALVAGDVTITASAEGRSGTAQVSVTEPTPPPALVDRVELDKVSEQLEEGATLQIQATAYDGDGNIVAGRAVQWSSGDAGIASVAPDGVVTGLRPGSVNVTARVDGKQASATVTVFANYPFELVYSVQVVGSPAELFSLDINDPAATAMPVLAAGQPGSQPTPSPDGQRLAYVMHGTWGAPYWQSMIFVADRNGGEATRITDLPGLNGEPAWSPDGMRIAFSNRPEGGSIDIWVMDDDGANPVNLTADQPAGNKLSPAWSAEPIDGSYRIAYAQQVEGASYLWTMRADGTDKRKVTADPAFFDSEPAWSPDGSTLVFQRTGAAVFGDLYLVPSAGGAPRALMPANPLAFGQFGPAWSPDGRLIAFNSKHADGQNYQVWTVWADGTRLAQRTREPADHADPAWMTVP